MKPITYCMLLVSGEEFAFLKPIEPLPKHQPLPLHLPSPLHLPVHSHAPLSAPRRHPERSEGPLYWPLPLLFLVTLQLPSLLPLPALRPSS